VFYKEHDQEETINAMSGPIKLVRAAAGSPALTSNYVPCRRRSVRCQREYRRAFAVT